MSFDALAGDFAQEACALIDPLEHALLELERAELSADERASRLASIRRWLHTLKGNAGLLGAKALQQALHRMEDFAEGLEPGVEGEGSFEPPAALLSALLGGIHAVREEIQAIGAGRALDEAIPGILRLAQGLSAAEAGGAAPVTLEVREDLRVSRDRLDGLIAAAGDLCVQSAQLLTLLRHGGESRRFGAPAERLEVAARSLHERILRLRSIRAGQLFERFERLVRDEAVRSGKRAVLRTVGDEVEVDKAVLEKLAAPLIHLVTNAVVHGLEAPAARVHAGKPEEGTVTLRATSRGNTVVVSIEDDGRGIDRSAIARRAAELGLDPQQSPESLIFEPGFSTASLSESAGRGIGLDAVRRAAMELGGDVSVQSAPGFGTAFEIRVPALISFQRSLLVGISGEVYAVPVSSVLHAARIGRGSIRWLGNGSALEHQGHLVPMVDGSRLGAGHQGEFAVVLSAGGTAALQVDSLRGQQDFVFHPLHPAIRGVSPVSGAALMADGRVVLRLDVEALVSEAQSGHSGREVRS